MNQKSEWEIVNEGRRSTGASYQLKDLMKALLGPAWRWKLAGVVVVALIGLSVLTVFAGIAIVGLITVALLLAVAAKLRAMVRRFRATPMNVQRRS